MSFIKKVVTEWTARRERDFAQIAMSFVDMSDSSIILQVNDRLIQILIPSSFQIEEDSCFPTSSSDEVFLVTSMKYTSDESFVNMLLTVNEKLERVPVQPDALSKVLDHLLTSMEKVGDSMQIQDNTTGFLCIMAESARQQCKLALETANGKDSESTSLTQSNYLRWCHVRPDPKSLTVHLLIHVGGIVRDDSLASALGVSVDSPVKFSLVFDKDLWAQRDNHLSKLIKFECKVFQEMSTCSNSLMEECDGGQPQNMMSHGYGKGVLLPKLVRTYFQFFITKTIMLEENPESPDLLDELREFTSMENMFVGLLCFLCARMRKLQDWCVLCWNSLPYSVCRLRTCDKDLCLFAFEELGVGAPVLQEVQTSPEIIDFQLSLAMVAAHSERDVFEPFPTFLLEKDQVRGRSGWFSKVERRSSVNTAQMVAGSSDEDLCQTKMTKWVSSNKKMSILKAVLLSYPSVAVMQECRDEVTLRTFLNKFWEEERMELERQTMEGKRPEEQEERRRWLKLEWLPYSLLRYVLSTSRLNLHLLAGNEQFTFFDSHHQFAVLHDSPEREAYFESRRIQQKGSFFAFHGSSADNWYSILRNGLRCLSKTPLMSSGVLYGTGIYLGNQLAVSLPFCSVKDTGWSDGALKNGVRVVAICEVINGSIRNEEDTINPRLHGAGIMVVPPEHENDVSIRYIIVLRTQNCCGPVPIVGTMMSERIDLMKHHQDLRLAHDVQQEEQRRIRSAERIRQMSELCCQARERGEESKESSRGLLLKRR